MSSPRLIDNQSLTRIPPAFIFTLILLLGLPVVALNYLDIDFSAFANTLSIATGVGEMEIEQQIRGYFRQTLLEWTAFSISAVTVLLAFTQYRLAKDRIALVIGLAVFFSGTVQALHTVIIDGLSINFSDQRNLDAVIWTLSNVFSGLILAVGLWLVLKLKDQEDFRTTTFVLINAFLMIFAITIIYYSASRVQLPEMWFEDLAISRPYELIYLMLYFVIIFFLYPRVYKSNPYILTNCIFYMAITQIVIAFYLMILSSSPYDSGYNIAYFLKIIYYFIPFSCLIINYVYSYNAVLEAQEELKNSQEKLKYIASHDALTNLYNRREFEAYLNRSISNMQRDKGSFALFIIDIDNFKTINDTLGHLQGDKYLKELSDKLSALTRTGDIVSRIGGDEYALITGKIKTSSSVKKLADRMVKKLNVSMNVDGKSLVVTVSIGIAVYPQDGQTTEELMKNADLAMYSAKKSGKNDYRFYEPKLSSSQQREALIETKLRQALSKNEFYLNFQPKFNLKDRIIVGAEVLLRWCHNHELGEISPDEFIKVAESSGLLVKIGEWVLESACQQIKTWLKKYDPTMVFSINILPVQFENRSFLNHLNRILTKFQYPAELLEFEITEALLMRSDTSIIKNLNRINDLSIHISLDDFGMGYSSLSRLKSLPIKTIKIDRFFVSEIEDDSRKVIVIDTIIKLAKELDMTIVAEGIETETQLQYLISRGCSYGQGFLLSKPLSADEFEKLAFHSQAYKDKNDNKSVYYLNQDSF